jgi:hypothetical protein
VSLSTRPPTRAPRTRRRLAANEPLHLGLALAVEACLLDEPGAELGEGVDEDIDLVQRVLDVERGVELELEVDPLRAVRDLEDDARLRVDVPVALVPEGVALGELAAGRVLDLRDDVGAAVEAGEVEEAAHVDARLVRVRHRLSLPSWLWLGRARADHLPAIVGAVHGADRTQH